MFTQQEQKQYYELAVTKLNNGEYEEAEKSCSCCRKVFQEQDFESYIKVNIDSLKILVNSQRYEEMFDYILATEPYVEEYAAKTNSSPSD